jgi:hypothetical protein
LAFRFAGCFATFLATDIAAFAAFTGLVGLAAFAGFSGLAAFTGFAAKAGFAGAPGFVGGCLPDLADCRLDLDDPDFTGIGMAAYTLLIFVS